MFLEILEGAVLRLIQLAVPNIDLTLATAIFDKLVVLATSPEEFWIAFNIAVAQANEGKVPDIVADTYNALTPLFGDAPKGQP